MSGEKNIFAVRNGFAMGVVEDFIQSENSRLIRSGQFSGKLPRYITVKDAIIAPAGSATQNKMTIRPFLAGQIVTALFLALAIFFLLLLAGMRWQNIRMSLPILLLLFIVSWIPVLIWFKFLRKQFVYKIVLDTGGIRLNKFFFPWSAIETGLVMIKGRGRRRESLLILFTRNKETPVFNIGLLNIAGEKLLHLMEQYRSATGLRPD